jgi:isopenicillin N synthase-like dioxygenase
MPIQTSHSQHPPFPSGIPSAPLVSISLAKLESRDAAESQSFYKACKSLGFFYLDMQGSALGEEIVSLSEEVHSLQKQFHALPNEVKEEYLREKIDAFFGYRILGEREMEDGSVGRNENYNVCKAICLTLPSHLSSLGHSTAY